MSAEVVLRFDLGSGREIEDAHRILLPHLNAFRLLESLKRLWHEAQIQGWKEAAVALCAAVQETELAIERARYVRPPASRGRRGEAGEEVSAPSSVPPPCATDVFADGVPVFMIAGLPPQAIEACLARVRERFKDPSARLDAKIDWHYFGGRAVVRVLGDAAAQELARTILRGMTPTWRAIPYDS